MLTLLLMYILNGMKLKQLGSSAVLLAACQVSSHIHGGGFCAGQSPWLHEAHLGTQSLFPQSAVTFPWMKDGEVRTD